MSDNMPTESQAIETNEELAYEVVLGFFDEDDICLRHGITHAQLRDVRSSPTFMRLLQDATRRIADDGDSFRIAAQKHAVKALETLAKMADGTPDVDGVTVSVTAQMRAAELMCKYAGYDREDTVLATKGMQIVLTTNLEMAGNIPVVDTYTIEAQVLPDVESLI